MKTIKIIASCACALAFIAPAFSTTMCVQNDNVAVILDPTNNGTGYDYDNNVGKWTTTFSWGTVSGVSACLSSNYSKSLGGTVSQLSDSGARVIGGEQNGRYCWCKMTHPAVSLWAFSNTFSSAPDCASNCTSNCGAGVRSHASRRAGLFGSVATN